jgi:hypothetical protein
MQERRLKVGRRRPPAGPEAIAASLESSARRRRIAPALLAALTGTIETVAETAGPVVEAAADAARGRDPNREQERLAVALRNLDVAMARARVAVRAALEDVERNRSRTPRQK